MNMITPPPKSRKPSSCQLRRGALLVSMVRPPLFVADPRETGTRSSLLPFDRTARPARGPLTVALPLSRSWGSREAHTRRLPSRTVTGSHLRRRSRADLLVRVPLLRQATPRPRLSRCLVRSCLHLDRRRVHHRCPSRARGREPEGDPGLRPEPRGRPRDLARRPVELRRTTRRRAYWADLRAALVPPAPPERGSRPDRAGPRHRVDCGPAARASAHVSGWREPNARGVRQGLRRPS